jgi:hypothetical protein
MRDRTFFASPAARQRAVVLALATVALAAPTAAHAQYNAPPLSTLAIGERYHVEFSGTLWNPTPEGTIASAQFGLPGTDLNFVTDLGFEQTRFGDMRVVLRPGRKHRLRIQYTPVAYTGESILRRTIVFNGISYPAALPVSSTFNWKVWRFGYEYDMVYMDRGFVGVLLEGRYTDFSASLDAVGRSEFTSAKGPLPAIGLVGRAYVAPSVALNFEVSGFKVPDASALSKYQANYYDWDIHGTVNLTNYFGVQVGWRRMTTFLDIDQGGGDRDGGDFKFQGLWFGASVRY